MVSHHISAWTWAYIVHWPQYIGSLVVELVAVEGEEEFALMAPDNSSQHISSSLGPLIRQTH